MEDSPVRGEEQVHDYVKEDSDAVEELFKNLQPQETSSECLNPDELRGEKSENPQSDDLLFDSDKFESQEEQIPSNESISEEVKSQEVSDEVISYGGQSVEELSEVTVASEEQHTNEPHTLSEQLKQESDDELEEDGQVDQHQGSGEEAADLSEEDVAEGPTPAETQCDSSNPAWLTHDFLKEVFASPTEGKREELTVISFEAKQALGKGDNYSSVIWRVNVEVLQDDRRGGKEPGHRSLIVKCLPEGESVRILMERSKVFPTEERIYRETIPRMHEVIKEKLRNLEFIRIAPRAFISSSGNLVFEDLSSQGFQMAKRQDGLDLEHCLLAMRALGVFHAVSMYLQENDPSLVDYIDNIYCESEIPGIRTFTINMFEMLAQIIKKWTGYQKYANKISELGKTVLDRFIELKHQTEDRFKVLIHGDYWVNNMLFKYSVTGEVKEIRMLDLQIARFDSLALDVQYFLHSSPNPDIRTEKMEEMIGAYHSTLGKALVRLGLTHRMMSRQELDHEIERMAPFGIITASGLLSVVLADPKDAVDLDSINPDNPQPNDLFSGAMTGKKFTRALKLLLPYWESKGFI